MADKIINSFDVWITAQGVKSRTRLRSVDNISLDGIEKLRELILEFAIHGKLISRNSDDEPAYDLLKKIQLERESLAKKGVIRKERDFPEISNDEKPFEIPKNWEWVRVDTVGHDWGQKEPKSEFNYIEVSGIDSDKGVINSTELLAAENAPSRARKIVKKGTLIYSTVRPYLKNICVVDRDFSPEPIASTAFAVLHPFQSMPGKYFFYYFRSPTFVKYVESVQIGVAYPAINDKQFFGGLVPLPPLAEQHRIVAKVDELMTLCDELEKQETDHLKSHQVLVETLLGTLTQAGNAHEFQTAWSRLAQYFDDIFTTEASIDQLKQTILQLAVMGKLVPQDPKDEPARELLKRIEREKERLVKEGMIKKKKLSAEIKIHEMSPELPNGWSWCRLNDIGRFSGGGTPSMSRNEYWGGEIPWISPKDMGNNYVSNSEMRITIEGVENSTAKMIPMGSLLIVARSGILKRRLPVAINTVDCTVNQDIKVLIPYIPKINSYLLLMFSGLEKSILESYVKIGTTVHSLKYESFEEMAVPIPPAQEQSRIIRKVEELFSLCDRLKERIAESQKVVNQMAEAVLEQVS